METTSRAAEVMAARPGNDAAGDLARLWRQSPLDYFLSVSFKQPVYDRFRLEDAERQVAFVRSTLECAGYLAPYAFGVHDFFGRRNMHTHLLLIDDGSISRVRRAFFRLGDLDDAINGPIRGDGAFYYTANRAFETGINSDHWWYEPKYRRRPRPHGRKRAQSTSRPA